MLQLNIMTFSFITLLRMLLFQEYMSGCSKVCSNLVPGLWWYLSFCLTLISTYFYSSKTSILFCLQLTIWYVKLKILQLEKKKDGMNYICKISCLICYQIICQIKDKHNQSHSFFCYLHVFRCVILCLCLCRCLILTLPLCVFVCVCVCVCVRSNR
jgi:hypothetical protein